MGSTRIPALALGVLLAGVALPACGDDDEKTTTVIERDTVTQAMPAPPPTEPPATSTEIGGGDEAILDAARARSPDANLTIRKRAPGFASVSATDFYMILAEIGGSWRVVFEGNGIPPPDVVERYKIPQDILE